MEMTNRDLDHGPTMVDKHLPRCYTWPAMEEIAISKFKATCLAVLERVRKTGRRVRVTRFGKPVADIVPPANSEPARIRLGTGAGMVEILGDIVGPIGDESDWEAARDESYQAPSPKG